VSHFAGRRKRSVTVIEQSALVGKIGQWENPLLYWLRDGLIAAESGAEVSALLALYASHAGVSGADLDVS
jgi:hypothetical protein